MSGDDIELKIDVRKRLLKSAYSSIYMYGYSQQQWENDPKVQALAKQAGLSARELDAIGALGRVGFKTD